MKNNLYEMIITDIKACNRINLPAGAHSKRNGREHYAVAVKSVGRTVYLYDGKEYVSDKEHLVILPKNISYSFLIAEAGECCMIEFDVAEANMNELTVFTLSNADEFAKLFRRAERALAFGKESGRLTALSCLYAVLAHTVEENANEYISAETFSKLDPAIRFLEENISYGTISNAELAQKCGISCVYFRKLFSRKFNMPPARYMMMLKIQRAKGLMLSDHTSMSDIAFECGFAGISHFSKAFKSFTGLTPSQYKLSLQKK